MENFQVGPTEKFFHLIKQSLTACINFLYFFIVIPSESILHSLFLASLFISSCIVYSQLVDSLEVHFVKVFSHILSLAFARHS